MIRRDDAGKVTTPYAFQVGFPEKLTSVLLDYCDELGITDLFRELTGDHPVESREDHSGRFVTLPPSREDGGSGSSNNRSTDDPSNSWYIQRPAKKWTSNMHWISPANEHTHEQYLKVLASGDFDAVLRGIGEYLGLEGLAAYHLTFIGVSYSEKGYIHHDSTNTGGNVYNVIIPLILQENADPELVLLDDTSDEAGLLKYQLNQGAMMGDDAMHGTEACDYRPTKGMRLAATVYIANVNYENVWDITSQTLTQIFPLPDARWLLTQAGRHWGRFDNENHSSLVNDAGRKQFVFYDRLLDCEERAANGMCQSGETTAEAKELRGKCMKSCHVYDESLNAKFNNDRSNDVTAAVTDTAVDAFFNSIGDDPSCVDENEDCPDLASKGLCMTDSEGLKQHGCRFSCMFCLSSESKHLFSLGEEQSFTEEGREGEELPSKEAIEGVIAESEQYMVNEVLLYDEYEDVRLSCKNFMLECSLWAAEGECDKDEETTGWMQKNCPAACRDCLGVNPKTRCPVDYDSDIFAPGDIDRMFERWLEEAGQDVNTFSSTNLPKGGKHPYGELKVVASPYQDMMPLLDEEDKQFAHDFTPVPWVVAIENFLSDAECKRLIELGGDDYERSTEYSGEMGLDGSYGFVESAGRTSTNTWCQDECRDDPVAKAVIERMTNMTGIPYDNYEDLQLVRYEPGQFYQKHHDYTTGHEDTQYGPRVRLIAVLCLFVSVRLCVQTLIICKSRSLGSNTHTLFSLHQVLTFFLYLNDVEAGGGTKFEDLEFIAQPKKGMALVWPSVVNENLYEKDDWTWHEAMPVKTGIKYGANAWIHLRDYQNVPDYC